MGAVNRRYSTPHWLLLFLYAVGVVPILAGFSVEGIARMVSIAATPMLALISVASLRLHTIYPDQARRAPFRVGYRVHAAIVILTVVILAVQFYLLVQKATLSVLVALVVWVLIGVAWWLVRRTHPAIAPVEEPADDALSV